MFEKFKSFLEQQQLLTPKDRCLLAVSGGVDSVVLVHLFERAGLDYGMAHCNFQLRGTASDADERFVQELALQFDRPFFTTRFDTETLAKQHKWSIQMAARQARYDWFKQIQTQNHYPYLATAHHLDDQLETFLYNFAKGTGIRGLRSIPLKNGAIIRPLQFADKAMIESFAKKHAIAFRTDPSNATDKYVRNQIRHHLIPALRKINPALSQTTKRTFTHLRETEQLLDWAISAIRKEVMKARPDGGQIDLEKLRTFPASLTTLFELL
ncbi:MAG: tRNA lysidine(34) synthetase TilS, partial [Bacteroidota bacterium]